MNRERALELKVGIFVAIGLAMIGGFVLKFGRLGEGFKIYYDLTVRFKDASGLLNGSDVVLSGAKIGRVSGGPRLLGEGVAVPLRIYEYVKLPKGSQFTVGSSGLLGGRESGRNHGVSEKGCRRFAGCDLGRAQDFFGRHAINARSNQRKWFACQPD